MKMSPLWGSLLNTKLLLQRFHPNEIYAAPEERNLCKKNMKRIRITEKRYFIKPQWPLI